MPKVFTIALKGQDNVSVSEEAFRSMEAAILDKADTMLKAGDLLFSARDVKFVRSHWVAEYVSDPAHEQQLPEEQRLRNLKRMAVMKAVLFNWPKSADTFVPQDEEQSQWFVEWLEFKETGNYPASGWRGKIGLTKDEYSAFRKEFFDVYMPDHEFEAALCRSWLSYQRNERDPRTYDRADLVERARQWQRERMTSKPNPSAALIGEAERIFHAKAS